MATRVLAQIGHETGIIDWSSLEDVKAIACSSRCRDITVEDTVEADARALLAGLSTSRAYLVLAFVLGARHPGFRSLELIPAIDPGHFGERMFTRLPARFQKPSPFCSVFPLFLEFLLDDIPGVLALA